MSGRASLLRRLLDGIYATSAGIAAACLAGVGVLVLAQVLARWFGGLLPSAEEFAGFLMAGATFLALPWTLRSGGHIRVALVIRGLGPRLRRGQEVLATSVFLVLAVALTWFATALAIESRAFGDVSGGYVAVPLWLPQLPMAVGLGVLSLALLDALVTQLLGAAPSWQTAEDSTAKQDAGTTAGRE